MGTRKLELQWEAIKRYPAAGIVFTDWLTFQDDGVINSSMLVAGTDKTVTPHHREIRAAYRMAVGDDTAGTSFLDHSTLCRSLIRYGPLVLPSAVVFRRDLALACGGFDRAMRRADDWDFWLRLAGQGASAVAIGRALVRYRYHATNVSRDFISAACWIAHMVAKARDAKDAYPAGMGAFWDGALPFYVHRAAWAAFKAGRFTDARDLYSKLVRYRPSSAARACNAAARLTDTMMGHSLYRLARQLKRSLNHAA